jgi:hypothetical protein
METIMNKTGNSSQYRELQDSELELVSGGEISLMGLIQAICSTPNELTINACSALVNAYGESIKPIITKA